jgi:ComEC/Rec2-related protein
MLFLSFFRSVEKKLGDFNSLTRSEFDINLRKYINPPNLFLLFLVFVTLINSFLQIQINSTPFIKDNETEFVARVVSREKSNLGYGSKYILLVDGEFWESNTFEFLKTGYQYNFLAKKIFFSTSGNSFERNKISLDVRGELEIDKIVAENKNCDLFCNFLKHRESLKSSINKRYQNFACGVGKFSTLLTPNVSCEDVSALAVGLTLGGTENFKKETKESLVNLSLSHIVAVSGFQVVLIASFAENIFNRLQVNRKKKLLAVIFSIGFLVFIVGPQPPVVRSSLSVLIGLFSVYFLGIRLDSFRSLAYSAILMLWINPLYILSLSFQLSILATVGLLMSGKQEYYDLNKPLKEVLETIKTTVFAFLYTLPIVLNLNGQANILGVLVNIVIVPIIPIITILYVLGLIPVIGDLFLIPANFLSGLMLSLIDLLPKSFLNKILSFKGAFNLTLVDIFFYFLIVFLIPKIIRKIIFKYKKQTKESGEN